LDDARALVRRLGNAVTFYKIGLELVMSGGMELAGELIGEGKRVFLDMKLLDIENTVEQAVRASVRSGATFLTVHGHDEKTLRAAVAGAAGTQLGILAVTVLTNLTDADLKAQGIAGSVVETVGRRAKIARDAGCAGIVASGQEARRVRAVAGPSMVIVTPGIRLPGEGAGDQSRVATPRQAVRDGADYIVVGRPITRADDPARAAGIFTQDIQEALASLAS
jgi:orotidine-5'-phosphate decarboxylase